MTAFLINYIYIKHIIWEIQGAKVQLLPTNADYQVGELCS